MSKAAGWMLKSLNLPCPFRNHQSVVYHNGSSGHCPCDYGRNRRENIKRVLAGIEMLSSALSKSGVFKILSDDDIMTEK